MLAAAPTKFDQPLQILGGHSGASLLLFARDQKTVVRKTAMARDGNVRLRQQAIKQKLFGAQGLGFPAVHRIDTDDYGLAFFEMDYVPARTLAEVVASAAPHDRRQLLSSITRLIAHLSSQQTGPLPPSLFKTKISDILRQSLILAPLAECQVSIGMIGATLAARDWSGIPYSPCHGDLTFENILISPEQGVVFIDCDEPFASSWWLDLAKLFQDVEGRWFLRETPVASVDALERLDLLGRHLRSLAGELAPALPDRLNQFAALHLFRTLPYVREPSAAGYVCAAIIRILEGNTP